MVVDVHVHSRRYPAHFNQTSTLDHFRGQDPDSLTRMLDHPVERYLALADGLVRRAVLLGLKTGETLGIEIPNDYLAEAARSRPDVLAWACCVVPTANGAAAEVERCLNLGACAIGELGPEYGNYRADDPRCFAVYEIARDAGVPILIHAGPTEARSARLMYADLVAIDNVAIQFPTLKVVLCHLGYFRYEEACHLVAKHPNVYADVSWLAAIAGIDHHATQNTRRRPPIIEYPYFHFLKPFLYYFSMTFGDPDKLLYGSDYPAGSPRTSIERIQNLNQSLRDGGLPTIPQEFIDRILFENWRRVMPGLAE